MKYPIENWVNGVQSHELVSEVRRIEYDYQTRTGILHLASAVCTDMQGALHLFERIDPEVCVIYTFAGMVEDTVYFKEQSGAWSAVTARFISSEKRLLPVEPCLSRASGIEG